MPKDLERLMEFAESSKTSLENIAESFMEMNDSLAKITPALERIAQALEHKE